MIVKLWAVAVGNVPSPFSLPSVKRKAKAALDLIKQQEGFVGVNPQPRSVRCYCSGLRTTRKPPGIRFAQPV